MHSRVGESREVNWKEYFYNEFPRVLSHFAANKIPDHFCEHCLAPKNRRCHINPNKRNLLRGLPARFRFSWYGVTLIDQVLFTYFPKASELWVKNTGGYPLPVEGMGFGCVRVLSPSGLLQKTDSKEEWLKWINFWLDETELQLEAKSGVKPRDFFEVAASDSYFASDPQVGEFESLLINLASEKFNEKEN